MKKILNLILVIALTSNLFAQKDWTEVVKFTPTIKQTEKGVAQLQLKAKIIRPKWHIFSAFHDMDKADGTGLPTKITILPGKGYEAIGKTGEIGKPFVHEVEGIGIESIFENEVTFTHKIKVLQPDFKLKFEVEFQVCEVSCIFPPAQEFSVDAKGLLVAENTTPSLATETSSTSDSVVGTNETTSNETPSNTAETSKTSELGSVIEAAKEEDTSSLYIFIAGFLAGLVALVTPCMFPMIPMTVTFFTKQSKTRSEGIRKAIIYGLSIIVIYVAFGLIFTSLTGSVGLNDLSTNIWMNLIFFAIFVLFAFSFLGAFEIQLPSSWVNKMDQKADKGGYVGIFFMAFTLGLVSFSCTGPIIGSLLVEASLSGSYLTPAIGMIGFSSALAIPFTLFAIFPGWLNSLPQSGGWLNSVKVVLGLLELALALKFLSAVDLAYHWDLLTREWFVAIWFVIFLVMGLYLLGKIRFSHDSPIERLSVTRFMFAFAALSFAVYLLPGMFGAPLQVIEGIAPPRTHSEDNFRFIKGNDGNATQASDTIAARFAADLHPVADGSIFVFHDLEKAKAYAKAKSLPILVDFTGHACQNCRKTESTVWTNDAIRPILQQKIVIASLYCDDREPLPASEVKYSEVIQGKMKTVGNKWSDFQIRKYKKIAQPLYVISDENGNDLTEAIGYTPDIESYKSFLLKGIEKFNRSKK